MSGMPGAFQARPFENGEKTEVKAYNMKGQVSTRVMDISFAEFGLSYALWKNGSLIQNAFPSIPKIDREFLMSGSEEDEWEEMFAPVHVYPDGHVLQGQRITDKTDLMIAVTGGGFATEYEPMATYNNCKCGRKEVSDD